MRSFGPDDGDFHAQVHAAAFADQWHGLGLDPDQLAPLIEMQSAAQLSQYRQQYPSAEWSVIQVAGQRLGRLVVDRTPHEVRVVDLALLAEARGQGIGSTVLAGLYTEAQMSGLPVTASVMASNAGGRSLFARLGFQEVATNDDVDPGLYIPLVWHTDQGID